MNRYLTIILGGIVASGILHAGTITVKGVLVVNSMNYEHNKGTVECLLYRKSDAILKTPFMKVITGIKKGRATCVFKDVPDAAYAVRVFHDQNTNGEIDHNFLSIPSEPLGFSNEWELSILSGLPTFEKLKFEFKQNKTIQIKVN